MKTRARSLLCCLLMLAMPALARPDAGTGRVPGIIGTVLDAQLRAPEPDVLVTATSPNLEGERTVLTDERGNYRLADLPPGIYTLRFEKALFTPFERPGIHLRPGRTPRVNAELIPESLGEVVETVGAAPTLDVSATAGCVRVDQEFIKRIAVARPRGMTGMSRSFEPVGAAPRPPTTTVGNGYVTYGVTTNDPAYGINPHRQATGTRVPAAPPTSTGVSEPERTSPAR